MMNPQFPKTPEAGAVPAPFEALMVLDRTASQIGPAGPTVASQMMQRFQPPPPPQGMPPQGMPPQGMPPQGPPQGPPGMMPNDPFRQQMMKTVQQQSQASAQPPQQPPQQPQRPQGMAHGGIASLRADNIARMKYAQGGVIGFANQGYVDPLGMGTAAPGEETSDTPGKKDKELLRALISMGMLPAAALDLLQAPAAAVAKTSLPGVDPNKFSYTPAVSALRNALANIDKPEAPSPAPEQVARPAVEDARRREDIPPGGMVVATPGGAAPAPAPRPPASPRPATPAAATAQPAMENPDLVVARRLRDAQFTGTAPTIESTLAEQQKFRAAQGLTGPVGSAIEAAMKTHAERAAATEAAYRKGQEGQGLESLIAALSAGRRGVGALGEQYVKGQEAQRAAEMNFQQLMNASAEKREQMGITLQNLREAEANRDYTAYQKNLDEFRKQKHDFDTVQRQLAASTLQGSVQMQEGAANRASQEKIARIREASQLGQLDMRRQAMAAQAAKAVEMDPLLKQLATLAMAGDPAATKRYQDREAEIYMRIAPELMLGGGAPSGGSALASATAIARGKQ